MTRVRIKPIKSTRKVLIQVPQEIHSVRRGIENGLHVIGEIVGQRIEQLIEQGPKTGRIYRFRGQDHQASAPGEAPANMTGRLVKSYNYNVHGPYSMEVGESAPYAGFLEDGTGRMKSRPHVLRAIRETQGDAINAIVQEVEKVRNK